MSEEDPNILATRSLELALLAYLLRDPADAREEAGEEILGALEGIGAKGKRGETFSRIAAQLRAGRHGEAYNRTFGHVPAGRLSPYETSYGSANAFTQSQALADLQGFYKAFGVEPSALYRERPDHLGLEAEFLSLVEFKEALALNGRDEEGAQICRAARQRFLENHIGRWAPVIFERLEREAADDLYRLCGTLGRLVLEEEILATGARCPQGALASPPSGLAEDSYPELFGCPGTIAQDEPAL
ncbi:MAG: molecular chaperone TorD family protein [Bdellovibrionota bacterium]